MTLVSRGVRYIDKPYRLSIYRHVLKISISISISIRSLLKISISISIKTFHRNIDIDKDILENIVIDIDIDKVILENIDIDIDKDILGKNPIFFSRN